MTKEWILKLHLWLILQLGETDKKNTGCYDYLPIYSSTI